MKSFDLLNLAGRVPLKFGHNLEQPLTDGQPALGWVERVYREGKKLLADFANMPSSVYEAIKNGLYKFVSVELLGDVQADTRVIPWVLDAVALLGADPPAVGNLKDLQQLTMARGSGLPSRVRVAFTRDPNSGGHRPNMADDPNKGGEIAALMARLDKIEAEKKALELKAAERESFERKLQELEASTRNEKIATHRTAVVALFEAAIKDKRITPSTRERFKRVYKLDTDAIIDVPLTDVETFIKENPNPEAPKKVTGLQGGSDSADAREDERLLHFARKGLAEHRGDPAFAEMPRWQQLVEATKRAMRVEPELARSYCTLPTRIAAEQSIAAAGGN